MILNKKYFRCFIFIFLALFLAGSCTAGLGRPAEAAAKKKVVRKLKVKKVKKKKIVRKKTRVAKKKLPRAGKVVKKAGASGTVTQDYALEEGLGGDEVDNLIGDLKAVGADEVAVDPATNMVSVTFRTSRLTSAGIVRKLKGLGYTAKRVL